MEDDDGEDDVRMTTADTIAEGIVEEDRAQGIAVIEGEATQDRYQ